MPAKQKDELVKSVDEFAKELMGLARNSETTLQVRLDVFRELARWVSVKHKINENEETGDDLDELRKRIRNPNASTAGWGASVNLKKRGGRYLGGKTPLEFGGSALAAIKRSLPRSNNGDDADNGHDT